MFKKKKQVVTSYDAPQAIGPYSQAIIANGLVFVSGQIAIEARSGGMTAGGITQQTRQVLQNLKGILRAAGSSLDKVIKTTVYLKDMDQFEEMNAVYGEFFTDNPPARVTVEVSRLPRDVLVEIECIASL